MTDFAIATCVQDAAQHSERVEVIRLTLLDQLCFAQALLSPAPPTPVMERAFARCAAVAHYMSSAPVDADEASDEI